MNQEQINELKESLFGYFNIFVPTTDGLHTMIDNHLRKLNPGIAFDALLSLGQKDLKAKSAAEAINHFREFYRMENEKNNKLKKPPQPSNKLEYDLHEIYLYPQPQDNRNPYILFLNLLHYKICINTSKKTSKDLYESIKNDLKNYIAANAENGRFVVLTTDKANGYYEKRMLVGVRLVQEEVQKMIDKYAVDSVKDEIDIF